MAQTTKQEVAVTSKSSETEKSRLPMLAEPYESLEQFFDRMFRRDWLRPFWREPLFEMMEPRGRWMSVDVISSDDHILVRAEMPGIDKKDVSVSMTDHLLTIKGTFGREEKEERRHYYRHEITRSAFERSILLPENIDSSKVEASLNNGVLEVTVGKAKESKHRVVEVK